MMTKFSCLPFIIGTVLVLWWSAYKEGNEDLLQYVLPLLVIFQR